MPARDDGPTFSLLALVGPLPPSGKATRPTVPPNGLLLLPLAPLPALPTSVPVTLSWRAELTTLMPFCACKQTQRTGKLAKQPGQPTLHSLSLAGTGVWQVGGVRRDGVIIQHLFYQCWIALFAAPLCLRTNIPVSWHCSHLVLHGCNAGSRAHNASVCMNAQGPNGTGTC